MSHPRGPLLCSLLLSLALGGNALRAEETIQAPLLNGEEVVTEEVAGDLAPELGLDAHGGGTDSCGCPLDQMYNLYNSPLWRVRAEGVAMAITHPDQRTLATLKDNATGTPFTRELGEFNFNYEPGMKLTLSRTIYDCSTYIELSYLGLPNWSDVQVISNNNAISFVSGDPKNGFFINNVQSQRIDYGGNFNDLELVLRTDLYRIPYVSVLGGFRYIHYTEKFYETEVGRLADNTVTIGRVFQSTQNDMLAIEAGFDAMIPIGPYVKAGGLLKAALSADITTATTETQLQSSFPGVNPLARTTTANWTKKAAGIFEAGLLSSLQLTRHMAIRGGYRCIYLAGIARAPDENIPPINSTTVGQLVINRSDVLIHGPFVSLEWAWGACH